MTEAREAAQHTDLVTVTIDDTTVSVPKGTLVIRAAELIGVQIPGSATTRCSSPSAPAGNAWSRSKASANRWPAAPSPSPTGDGGAHPAHLPCRREGPAGASWNCC